MNNKQRDKINEWIESINAIKDGVESMQNEEEEKFDNMPENLQESERGYNIQFAIENLENAASYLEEAIDSLNEASE